MHIITKNVPWETWRGRSTRVDVTGFRSWHDCKANSRHWYDNEVKIFIWDLLFRTYYPGVVFKRKLVLLFSQEHSMNTRTIFFCTWPFFWVFPCRSRNRNFAFVPCWLLGHGKIGFASLKIWCLSSRKQKSAWIFKKIKRPKISKMCFTYTSVEHLQDVFSWWRSRCNRKSTKYKFFEFIIGWFE